MSSTLNQLSHCSCQVLHTGVQWLVYLRFVPGKNVLEIGVTDGVQKMYRQSFTLEKINASFDRNPSETEVNVKLREAFQKNHIQLNVSGGKMNVNLRDQANFELAEISGNEIKSEISKLLFSFADKCRQLNCDLQLYQSRDVSEGSDAVKSDSKSPKKRVHDAPLTSAINPGQRPRKKATGLDYD